MLTPQQAVKSLIESGFTQNDIAKAMKTNQAMISGIYNGREPKYGLGLRLVAMANKKAKQAETASV